MILWIFPTLGEMLAERFDDLSDLHWDTLFGQNWLSLTNSDKHWASLPGVSVSFEELSELDTQTHKRGQHGSKLFILVQFQTIRSLHSVTELCGLVARLSVEPFLGGCNLCIRLTGAAQDFEICSSFDGCDRLVVAWRQILQAIRQDKYVQTCD